MMFIKRKHFFYAGPFMGALLLLLMGFGMGQAQTSEAVYDSAVRQLQAEGYAGIDKALQVFEDLIVKDPAFLKSYVSAADAYLLKYEFSDPKDSQWLSRALQYLETAAAREPGNAVLYFKRAVIEFNLNQPERAAADIQQALAREPRYLDARLLYLQYLLSAKRTEEARKFVDASLVLFPNDPGPMKYLADVALAGGDNETALKLYEKIIPLVPQAPNTWLAMGKARLNLKQYAPAIEALQKALAQDPALAEAYFLLSLAYSETGKMNEAIAQLENYNQKVPGDASALNNLALLYEQSGQKTKARLTWLKLKALSPDAAYRERVEKHLLRLAEGHDKAKPSGEDSPGPATKGMEKNEK
jgi:tetratricopeptide (TPR) repeat protein